jgi:hypothetical protein
MNLLAAGMLFFAQLWNAIEFPAVDRVEMARQDAFFRKAMDDYFDEVNKYIGGENQIQRRKKNEENDRRLLVGF